MISLLRSSTNLGAIGRTALAVVVFVAVFLGLAVFALVLVAAGAAAAFLVVVVLVVVFLAAGAFCCAG